MTVVVRAALTLLLAGALTWAATGQPAWAALGCGAAAATGLAALAVAAARLPQRPAAVRPPDIVIPPTEAPLLGRPIPGLRGREDVQRVLDQLVPRTALDGQPAKETHP